MPFLLPTNIIKVLKKTSKGLFDYWIWIRIHSEPQFRFTWQIE